MKQPYIIFSDISADILPAVAEENGIRFLPMHYTLGEEDRLCTQMEDEETLKRFYDGQRSGDLTRTSQIPPQAYVDTFLPVLEGGQSVLYISLSSGLSNTYQSSCMAAMELNGQFTDVKVMCVDSLSATAGIGLLLECAAENRAQGMTVEENAAWLEENRLRLCHWVMVEDLMYLKRGGRLSAATAVIGTALNIKPMLWIDPQGKLQNFAKVRGLKPALNQLLRYYENAREGGENERVYVVHSDNKEGAAYLAEEIRRRYPACRVTIQMLCPIIGAHTGPGLCAVVHFGNRES